MRNGASVQSCSSLKKSQFEGRSPSDRPTWHLNLNQTPGSTFGCKHPESSIQRPLSPCPAPNASSPACYRSYAAIGVNVFYTIASVPLALHYLNKEEFGLWALVTQLSGYLMLLEFGTSGSVARSLSDHKDHIEDGIYGNILRTGARVFLIQGFFVALLGGGAAWCAPTLLGLPLRLQHPFAVLMAVQALLTGTRLAVGALGSPLWCHQRLDLSNLAASISLIVTFAVLWLGFHLGWHLYSLPVSTAAGFAVSLAITYCSCRRLGFYPPPEHRGRFDPSLFRTLLHFGSGLFLMNLGAQLASAS